MKTIRNFLRNITTTIIGILPACTLFQRTLPKDYFDTSDGLLSEDEINWD